MINTLITFLILTGVLVGIGVIILLKEKYNTYQPDELIRNNEPLNETPACPCCASNDIRLYTKITYPEIEIHYKIFRKPIVNFSKIYTQIEYSIKCEKCGMTTDWNYTIRKTMEVWNGKITKPKLEEEQ